ncbi:hypothetical protein [Phyllobacterium bourgognense]|uniref:Uncharacterized protein n=1 Tax=Phyllobacterium bourgognense TaxID=314236 RepID=A0A368YNR1_9HYPH|nr:hypothetical protein [Phyllobacterium bourgognense]RCW80926.1 hypothetical protein C7476_11282 [Phyllobacterium bourgognense]
MTKKERSIPELTDVSPEYARLRTRQAELSNRNLELDEESRNIRKAIADEQGRDFQKERVDAIVEGINYEPPLSVREKMGKIAREKQDIQDALHLLANRINEEHRKASRVVISEFLPDQRECAAEFFSHIAAAAKAHNQYGEIRRRLERAGINVSGLDDFGQDLFGFPLDRNGDAGYALRDALKRGYITVSEIPVEYR